MTDQDHGPDLERARELGRAQERPFAGAAGVPFPTSRPICDIKISSSWSATLVSHHR